MPKQPTTSEHPIQFFRLPYAHDIYVCSCGAPTRSDCTCAQDEIVTTHNNRHQRDPKTVAWIARQTAPFSLQEAAEALWPQFNDTDANLLMRVHLHGELSECGCKYDEALKRFIPPDADTLRRLHLRPPAGTRSRCEEYQSSPLATGSRPEPSPTPRADHQSLPGDPARQDDQPTPR